MAQADVVIARQPGAKRVQRVDAAQQVEEPDVFYRCRRLILIQGEKPLSSLETVDHRQVEAALRQVIPRVPHLRGGPVNHRCQPAVPPDRITRPVVAVDQAGACPGKPVDGAPQGREHRLGQWVALQPFWQASFDLAPYVLQPLDGQMRQVLAIGRHGVDPRDGAGELRQPGFAISRRQYGASRVIHYDSRQAEALAGFVQQE